MRTTIFISGILIAKGLKTEVDSGEVKLLGVFLLAFIIADVIELF